jgi:hypothetical protein
MRGMHGMRRTMRNLAGWLLAAGAAVALSWTVITDATGPTTAAPIAPIPGSGTPPPLPSGAVTSAVAGTATASPGPSRSLAPAANASASATRTASSPVAGPASPATTPGTVRSYQVTGGQVVLLIRDNGARLLSATPAAGYRAQDWQADGWLRVDFTTDAHTSSVFVTWNGHPPAVQTAES